MPLVTGARPLASAATGQSSIAAANQRTDRLYGHPAPSHPRDPEKSLAVNQITPPGGGPPPGESSGGEDGPVALGSELAAGLLRNSQRNRPPIAAASTMNSF